MWPVDIAIVVAPLAVFELVAVVLDGWVWPVFVLVTIVRVWEVGSEVVVVLRVVAPCVEDCDVVPVKAVEEADLTA